MNTYTQKQKNNFLTTQTFEKKTIHLLSGLVFVFVLVYAWALISTVFTTAERKGLVVENAKLAGDVARLESQYLEQTKNFNEAYALSIGLSKSKEIYYASRDTHTDVAINR